MAGFSNKGTTNSNVMFSDNSDFTGSTDPDITNGLQTNGQLWIGSTAANAGVTHINVGLITSPLGTLTVGYSSPNITLDLAGGSVGIDSVAVQTGTSPVVPTAAGLLTINGAVVAAGTNPVRTDGTGANTLAVEVQISQAIASTDATKIGLSTFNSSNFSVDANGFVSIVSGGFPWSDVSGAFSPLKENGYFVTGTATGTLPAAPAQGDTIKFFVDHASQLLTIQATGTQLIRFATQVSSAAGTAVSTQRGDSVELVYRASDTQWCAVNFNGGWNIT